MGRYLRIHEKDNVVIAIDALSEGSVIRIGDDQVLVTEEIPAGHKVALYNLSEGDKVIKYGMPIGIAGAAIKKGQWLHTHNLKTQLQNVMNYCYEPVGETEMRQNNIRRPQAAYSFFGFRRERGKVGIRNEIWIIPTAGCVNNVAQALARQGRERLRGSVEAVVAFPHPYGCSQLGEDQENTRQILADLVEHPNAGGVLLLGLGCENSGVEEIKKYCKNPGSSRISYLVCQDYEDEIEEGIRRLEELIGKAAADRREEIPASELIIGLKCGGSDGFSGITANPLTGAFSDWLIACGGSTILTEVPEMFGAETLLMNRCETKGMFEKTVKLIQNFKDYFTSYHQPIYENPSPGNKAGGISTLEEKSLGCTQKSGNAPISDVLSYGEGIKKKGLNLLSAPGNDLVAATALAAAGAHIVLFTTGRGTPFSAPVPTVKIASNHLLGERKKNWIDFDAGAIADGAPLIEMAELFFAYVLEVASGRKVKAEESGYRDMAIFKQGVTL